MISHMFFNSINNKYIRYICITIFCSLLAFLLILFLFNKIYNRITKEKIADNLLSSYNIVKLYKNEDIVEEEKDIISPFVIGIIKIEKIDLNYPIISECNDDLLEISICRFFGPLPNKSGNLCLAGHNYYNNTMFSRINELYINDIIEIYDLSGDLIKYYIYDKYEITTNDKSCMSQQTEGKKEITLLTCNNVTGKRIVIKAKESK